MKDVGKFEGLFAADDPNGLADARVPEGVVQERLIKIAITLGGAGFERWLLAEVCAAYRFSGAYWLSCTPHNGIHLQKSRGVPNEFFRYLSDRWHESPLTSDLMRTSRNTIWPDDLLEQDAHKLPVLSTIADRWQLLPVTISARRTGPGTLHNVISFFKASGAQHNCAREDRARLALILEASMLAKNIALLADARAANARMHGAGACIFDHVGYVHAATEDMASPVALDRPMGWRKVERRYHKIARHQAPGRPTVVVTPYAPGLRLLVIVDGT